MDRQTKWRSLWLGLVVVLAVCTLLPTIVPQKDLPRWFRGMFSKKVQLGLDLQGGLHIVYSVDLNKAIDDKASELKRDIEDKLLTSNIQATVRTPRVPVGAITITPANAADLARIDDKFMAEYTEEVLVVRDCPPDDAATSKCFRVGSDYAAGIKDSALEQAIKTVRERIDERGVAEPSVVRKGDQIIVELPGLDKETTDRIRTIIKRTAKLEFKIVDNGSEFMEKLAQHTASDPLATELGIEVQTDDWVHDDTGKVFEDVMLVARNRTEKLTEAEAREAGCWSDNKGLDADNKVSCTVTGRQRLEKYLAAAAAANPELVVDDNHQIAFEEVAPRNQGDTSSPLWRTYYLHRPVELSGTAVSNAQVFWAQTTNRPEVLVTFNRFGGRRFGELTSKNVGRKMAIILDDKVNSAPVIQSAITGGRSTITMGGSDNQVMLAEAEDLVNVLRTGSLPAPLQEASSSEVGPLLGRDAVDKAKFSFILGSLLVVLIMVVYYRVAGTISIAALTINITLMISVLAAFGATLTLPGIAAIVLTVGMAVDANIIIYERIREELRAGKSVRGAVDAGFKHALSAIIDGNLTTAVAAYVLYNYGSGPIQGFATMLMIGIACTLFTAFWCTRLFFDYYIGRGRKAQTISI